MKRFATTTIITCFSICICSLMAQPDVVFESWITSGLSAPVDIANAGDGTNRLFIVEQSGVIQIIEGNAINYTPFMDISGIVSCCGERGLLGLVFHPDYSNNGYFYVHYIGNDGDTRISRFEVDPNDDDLGDPNSELVLLTIDQPYTNHNGGDLNFGPNDGYLYIALGDGGSGGDPQNRAQNGRCFLGKILRIDVDGGGNPASPSQMGGNCIFTSTSNYTIPADNPFVSDPFTLNEIWSTGWRNPWRFSFDSANGNMWIADVGQNDWEEVDFEESGMGGENYGWRCYEGDHEYNTTGCDGPTNYVYPAFEYENPTNRSVTGGYVYRGTAFPNMVGYYVLADYITDDVWTLFREENGDITSTDHGSETGASNISTFGVDENGEMYAASLGGTIYKVEDNSPLPVELSSFTGFQDDGNNMLNWTTESESNSDYFDIEKSIDGITFTTIGKVEARGNSNVHRKYQFEDRQITVDVNYYRLKIVDYDDQFEYSNIINITTATPFNLLIQPNPNDGKFSISINGNINSKSSLKIFNSSGELILTEEFERTKAFQKTYDLGHIPKGIYMVQFSSGDFVENRKLIIR